MSVLGFPDKRVEKVWKYRTRNRAVTRPVTRRTLAAPSVHGPVAGRTSATLKKRRNRPNTRRAMPEAWITVWIDIRATNSLLVTTETDCRGRQDVTPIDTVTA